MADDSVSLGIVLLKIVGFFAFSGIIGLIFYKIYKKWVDEAEKELHRHTIIAFVFCLIMAFVAEEVFGVADITGAYIAGLIISNVQRSTYLESKFDTTFWDEIHQLRDDVKKSLEVLIKDKTIKSSLEAKVTLKASGEKLEFLKKAEPELAAAFIVSG